MEVMLPLRAQKLDSILGKFAQSDKMIQEK